MGVAILNNVTSECASIAPDGKWNYIFILFLHLAYLYIHYANSIIKSVFVFYLYTCDRMRKSGFKIAVNHWM